jgi:TonB family protein
MFGFGRSKCSQCGEALESMGQSGGRTDDLMKNSAMGGKQTASGLCARCRAMASAGVRKAPSNNATPTPASVPRTIAQVTKDNAAQTETGYKPGNGFKTESELQETGDNSTEFANVKDLGSFLIWAITTKAGRNTAAVLFFLFFIGIRTCSNGDDYEPVDMPAPTETPPATINSPPPAMPPTAGTARPSNNPGSWVTTNDYPARALREERQGASSFRVVVNAQGVVSACEITQSSGHADLDAATCAAVQKRARFDPGTGDRSYRNRVQWRIPK